MITITVPAVKPKGRPRFARVGRFVRTYTDAKTVKFEKLVAFCAKAAGVKPIDGPVGLDIEVTIAVPKSVTKVERQRRLTQGWHTQVPDLDNLEKAVQDALNGVAWRDDSQVASKMSSKRWGTETKTVVTVSSLPQPFRSAMVVTPIDL